MNQLVRNIDEAAAQGAPADRLACGSDQRSQCGLRRAGLGRSRRVGARRLLPGHCRISAGEPAHADRGRFQDQRGRGRTDGDGDRHFALLSSLFVTAVIRNLDRRIVMLGFTILLLIVQPDRGFRSQPSHAAHRARAARRGARRILDDVGGARRCVSCPRRPCREPCRSSSAASRPPRSSLRPLESTWAIFSAGAPCSSWRRVCPRSP